MAGPYNIDESLAPEDPDYYPWHEGVGAAVNDLHTRVAAVESGKAPLASPALTGNPTAPTQTAGNNSTRLATTAFVQTASGLLVPKSLVDAKGDLIVATGNDTVSRLPVGSDGQVLTADSAQASGVKWATPSGGGDGGANIFPNPPGAWIGQSSVITYTQTNNGQLPAGRLWCESLRLTEATPIDRMGVSVQTAGEGGSVIRLGVYSLLPSGDIDDCLIDAGTTAADSTGDKSLTLGAPVTLEPGIYWMVGVSNDSSGTLRVKSAGGSPHIGWHTVSPISGTNVNSERWIYVYYTGYDPTVALPSTGSLTGRTPQGVIGGANPEAPLFWVRRQP